MAQLTCSTCGLAAEDDDLVCRGCSGNLSRPVVARYPLPGPPPHTPAAGVETPGPVDEADRADRAGEEEPRVCPHCGAAVPVPTNQVCVVCQRMLGEVRPSRTDVSGEVRPSRTDVSGERAVEVRATRRDVPTTVLRIRFGAVERTVTPGSTLLLGRAPAAHTTRGLLERHDNVSRQHATVGLEPDGTAWVRDEHSTNGTFVNGSPIGPGVRTPLRDGDVLRLAADCNLGITVERPGEADRR
ncbi:FHA domain-containing protein [Streptomyces sp. NPDC049602]|uniref:FHA domain-containing protein n=1 Tax=Streptomyces sp. NPDC049602 TaxID=3155504 RepID=UPI003437EFD1